jgi:hypothetical protein
MFEYMAWLQDKTGLTFSGNSSAHDSLFHRVALVVKNWQTFRMGDTKGGTATSK